MLTPFPQTFYKIRSQGLGLRSQGLNGKDAAILGKQVLMFDEKKI